MLNVIIYIKFSFAKHPLKLIEHIDENDRDLFIGEIIIVQEKSNFKF